LNRESKREFDETVAKRVSNCCVFDLIASQEQEQIKMEQTSHIRVERHESVLSWTLNGLNDFPWHEGNFLKSDEIKFEGIDVSW